MTSDDDLKQHYLFPGNIFAHKEPHFITTVLGSCVAVCLWDPVLKCGGMNHFMLPLWNGDGLASPRYGNIAIPKLLDKMIGLGCKKSNIKAKVFGGGEVLKISQGIMNVGERNIVIARDMLKEVNIPIIGSDLGGTTGRKIIFNTETGSVYLKRLRRQVDDIKIIKP